MMELQIHSVVLLQLLTTTTLALAADPGIVINTYEKVLIPTEALDLSEERQNVYELVCASFVRGENFAFRYNSTTRVCQFGKV